MLSRYLCIQPRASRPKRVINCQVVDIKVKISYISECDIAFNDCEGQ